MTRWRTLWGEVPDREVSSLRVPAGPVKQLEDDAAVPADLFRLLVATRPPQIHPALSIGGANDVAPLTSAGRT